MSALQRSAPNRLKKWSAGDSNHNSESEDWMCAGPIAAGPKTGALDTTLRIGLDAIERDLRTCCDAAATNARGGAVQ